MITDENHPRMLAAQKDLHGWLNARFMGHRLDRSSFDEIQAAVNEFRSHCRRQDIDFPKLRALIVPELGICDLVNAELEGRALEMRIVIFVRNHPQVNAQQVAAAVRRAFPDYRGVVHAA